MLCGNCGATLRATARFCNKCGALQPPTGGAEVGANGLTNVMDRLRPASRPLGRETVLLNGRAAAPPTGALDADMAQQSDARGAIADQPTTEYAKVTPTTGSHASGAGVQPPWPLPIGDVLEGRYRVESVVEAAPDAPGSENVYHVVDLRGYERCWSCGAQHGPAARDERFCPQCGADMIGHEYLMTERREETENDTRPELPTSHDEALALLTERVFARYGRRYQVTEIERERSRFPYGPHITISGSSHVGLTRAGETNEDSFGTLALNLSHDSLRQPVAVAIVADGLGGHASGQDASRLAVRIFIERLMQELIEPMVLRRGSSLPPDEVVEAALRDATLAANAGVYAENVNGAADMGSTLVGLVIVGEMAWIVNAGDSRAYVQDEDGLRRVTSDHSLVEQLILSGMIPPEERYTHPQRNRIYRSLGGDPQLDFDVFNQRLRPGMRLLLCSDGLWEMTRDAELEEILRTTANPYSACAALISSANANGGEDNITAIVAQVDA